ncbi:MAG: TadE family protein [Ilumatobacteraceae bacterium]
MRRRTRHNRPGQATVEFALVAPLFVACTLALVGTAVVSMRLVGVHDIARTATRAAAVADDPCTAAQAATPPGHRVRCTLDDGAGTVTVAVSSTVAVPFVGRIVETVLPWMESTMMLEPPAALG